MAVFYNLIAKETQVSSITDTCSRFHSPAYLSVHRCDKYRLMSDSIHHSSAETGHAQIQSLRFKSHQLPLNRDVVGYAMNEKLCDLFA